MKDLPCCPHKDLTDPSEHVDDSYGGCVICRLYIPHTDDETRMVSYPCAVVREAELKQELEAALLVEKSLSAMVDSASDDIEKLRGTLKAILDVAYDAEHESKLVVRIAKKALQERFSK